MDTCVVSAGVTVEAGTRRWRLGGGSASVCRGGRWEADACGVGSKQREWVIAPVGREIVSIVGGLGGDRSIGGESEVWVLVGLSVIIAAAAAYEIVPVSIGPVVTAALAVGPVAVGWLVSGMLLIQAIVGIPSGYALDHVDNRRMTIAAGLLFVLASVWSWQASRAGSYPALFASRLLAGVAFVVIWNGGANMIAGVFSAGQRATAVGIFTASGPAGFAVGHLTGPLIVARFEWGVVFPVYGVVALVGLGIFVAGSRGRGVLVESRESPRLQDIQALLGNRTFVGVLVTAFAAYSAYLFFNSWLPTYIEARVGLSLAATGVLVAVLPAMGIAARAGGGALSDRIFDGRRRPVMVLSLGVTGITAIGFVFAWTTVALFVLLVLAGFFVQLGVGVFYAAVQESVPPSVAVTAIALLTTASLLGSFSSPVIAGFFIERLGFVPAFAYAAVLGGLGVVSAWFTPEPG